MWWCRCATQSNFDPITFQGHPITFTVQTLSRLLFQLEYVHFGIIIKIVKWHQFTLSLIITGCLCSGIIWVLLYESQKSLPKWWSYWHFVFIIVCLPTLKVDWKLCINSCNNNQLRLLRLIQHLPHTAMTFSQNNSQQLISCFLFEKSSQIWFWYGTCLSTVKKIVRCHLVAACDIAIDSLVNPWRIMSNTRSNSRETYQTMSACSNWVLEYWSKEQNSLDVLCLQMLWTHDRKSEQGLLHLLEIDCTTDIFMEQPFSLGEGC